MFVTELLARARSALGKAVPYKLGSEGGPFVTDSEEPPAAGLDCSRFVLWALRHAGAPMDTAMIVKDANAGASGFFRKLSNGARPGCLIVYPDYEARVFGRTSRHDGHVGIVTNAEGGKAKSVIHCSRVVEELRSALLPGTPPDSIVESGPLWFPAFAAIYVWYNPLSEQPCNSRMSEGIVPDRPPEMALARARELLASGGVTDAVALLGVRGFFGAMGAAPANDPGIYDDAIFLVTPDNCSGYVFNTDPTRFTPPNVTLKTGTTRYKRGKHTSPTTGESYDALVQTGLPGEVAWVVALPLTLADYRLFAKAPGVRLNREFDTIAEYRRALEAEGGRLMPDDSVEWPMKEHINIHRGGSLEPSSKGCQTVHPSMWAAFIDAVYAALASRRQSRVPYLLIEAGASTRAAGDA